MILAILIVLALVAVGFAPILVWESVAALAVMAVVMHAEAHRRHRALMKALARTPQPLPPPAA